MWVYPADGIRASEESKSEIPPAGTVKDERPELRFSDGTRARHYRAEPRHIGRKTPGSASAAYRSGQSSGSGQQFRSTRTTASGSSASTHPAAADAALSRKKGASKEPSCLLFVLFYAAGLLLSGVLYGLCGQKELLFLQTYIQLLQTTNLTAQPLRLFCLLFLCAGIAVTLVLIFSLCAFGAPLLLLLTALYGVGSGLISVGLFDAYAWQGILVYLLAVGVYNAIVGCSICILSRSGVEVSTTLFALSTHSGKSIPQSVCSRKAQNFIRCYVCLLLILAPLCGLCAAFSGFAGNILA